MKIIWNPNNDYQYSVFAVKMKFFDWKNAVLVIITWVSYYFHIILLLLFSFFPFSLIIISAYITSSPYSVLSLLPQALLFPILFIALPSHPLSVWVRPIFQLRVQHNYLRPPSLVALMLLVVGNCVGLLVGILVGLRVIEGDWVRL